MSATGLGQDPSMGTWILEENVVFWQRLCSMSPLQTGLNSGMADTVLFVFFLERMLPSVGFKNLH